MSTKLTPEKVLHDVIVGKGDTIVLFSTKEAAEYLGIPHGTLVVSFFKAKDRPRHYLIGDVIEIYFEKETLDDFRDLLCLEHKAVGHE